MNTTRKLRSLEPLAIMLAAALLVGAVSYAIRHIVADYRQEKAASGQKAAKWPNWPCLNCPEGNKCERRYTQMKTFDGMEFSAGPSAKFEDHVCVPLQGYNALPNATNNELALTECWPGTTCDKMFPPQKSAPKKDSFDGRPHKGKRRHPKPPQANVGAGEVLAFLMDYNMICGYMYGEWGCRRLEEIDRLKAAHDAEVRRREKKKA